MLHLGAGRVGHNLDLPEYPDAEIITLDANSDTHPDIVCKLGVDPIPLADNSVDLAIAIHVLEHIGQQGSTTEWFQFFEELYRVLKPDGILFFLAPLWSSVWAWADPSHSRGLSIESFVYFRQDSYRIGGSISPFRIKCDFAGGDWKIVLDQNPEIAKREPGGSHFSGQLRAIKPFRAWWDDSELSQELTDAIHKASQNGT